MDTPLVRKCVWKVWEKLEAVMLIWTGGTKVELAHRLALRPMPKSSPPPLGLHSRCFFELYNVLLDVLLLFSCLAPVGYAF